MRYDYGSFAKATTRLLSPRVAGLGYRSIAPAWFARDGEDRVEGFFLSRGRFSSDFAVCVGIHLPRLADLWQNASASPLSLVVAGWLAQQGVDHRGERYKAANLAELTASLDAVARALPAADDWYARLKSVDDIVAEYGRKNGLESPGGNDPRMLLGIINYGFLLRAANRPAEARPWLDEAQAFCREAVAADDASAAKRRPGRQVREIHRINRLRLSVVEAALRGLES